MRSHVQIAWAILQLLLSIVAIAFALGAPTNPSRVFILSCLGLVLCSLAIVVIAKLQEPKPRNWLTVEVLFALSYSVIHFAYICYWLLGFFPAGSELWFYRAANCPHTVNTGIAMYAACLCGFQCGFYLLPLRRVRSRMLTDWVHPGLARQWGALGRILIRMGFLAFAGFVMIIGPQIVFGYYRGTNVYGFVPNIFFQLGQVWTLAGIAISTASHQTMFIRRPGRGRLFGFGRLDVALIAITVVAIGMHGDRSTLLFIFLGFLVAHNEYARPLSLRFLSLLGLDTIFALGFIVTVRSVGTKFQTYDPLENINVALANLGGSSLCGFVAVDYVPDRHDYYYGRMQTLSLAGIMPFGRRLLGMKDSIENSSSMLMTKLIQGFTGKGVAGTGTSVFADFYLDFGFLITLGIFIGIGYLSKYIQNAARCSLSLRWQVALITYVTFIALMSRYTFVGGLIRYVIYGVLYATVVAMFFGIRMVASPPSFRSSRAPGPMLDPSSSSAPAAR